MKINQIVKTKEAFEPLYQKNEILPYPKG